MKIEKIKGDSFFEINLDDFNRQQEVTRIYVRKGETYVLEEHRGVMDWSIDRKREVAHKLIDSEHISYLALEEDRIVGFASMYCLCVRKYKLRRPSNEAQKCNLV